MYTTPFGFNKDPFYSHPDRDLVYQSSSWKSIHKNLSVQILMQHGIILLLGETGAGKTLLLSDIESCLDTQTKFVYPPIVSDSFDDFITSLCGELVLNPAHKGFLHKMQMLNELLTEPKQKPIVVVIDDASTLSDEMLNNILLIATPPEKNKTSFQIVLSGLPELRAKFDRLTHQSSFQSTATFYPLKSLDSSEVRGFIGQRLKAVDYPGDGLFAPDAVSRIVKYSKGIPLLINALCRLALKKTHQEEKQIVSARVIEEVYKQGLIQEIEKAHATKPAPSKLAAVFQLAKTGQQTALQTPVDTPIENTTSDHAEVITRPISALLQQKPLRNTALGFAALSMLYVGTLIFAPNNPPARSTTIPVAIPSQGDTHPQTETPFARMEARKEIPDYPNATASVTKPTTSEDAGRTGKSVSSKPVLVEKVVQLGNSARQLILEQENSGEAVDLYAIYNKAELWTSVGQTADAYLLYFYAARLGDANAAFKLAQLADPATFNPDSSLIKAPNPAQAHKWYVKADHAGHPKADEFLHRLRSQVEKQAVLGDERAQQLTLQWR